MSKKDEFKIFVKNHPELIKYVNNNEMTWQKFFDMYVLYGSNNEVWTTYLNNKKTEETKEKVSFSELIDMAKKVDVDSLQKNITNINKGLALIESLIVKDDVSTPDYTPRPLYKKFED